MADVARRLWQLTDVAVAWPQYRPALIADPSPLAAWVLVWLGMSAMIVCACEAKAVWKALVESK
jgi:hypothetical protein